jgi:hypothetical protein
VANFLIHVEFHIDTGASHRIYAWYDWF